MRRWTYCKCSSVVRHVLPAVAAIVATLLFRALLPRSIGDISPFIVFFPSIILVALFGSALASLMTTALASFIVGYLLFESHGFVSVADYIGLALFLFAGLLICLIAYRYLRDEWIQYQLLIKNNPVVILSVATDGCISSVNPAAERILGYSKEELLSMKLADVCLPEDRERALGLFENSPSQGASVQREADLLIIRKDGERLLLRIIVTVTAEGAYCFAEDITARKRAEQGLKLSEQRFRDISEASGELLWEIDASGKCTYVNHICETMLGYSEAEVVGKLSFYDLHPDGGKEEFRRHAFATFEKRERYTDFQNKLATKDGRILSVLTSGVPMFDDNGVFQGYRGSDRDITELKRAEETLRESEEKYRALFDCMSQAAFVRSADGKLLEVNPAGLKMLGVSPEEFFARSGAEHWGAIDEDGTSLSYEQFPSIRAIQTGKPVFGEVLGVINNKTKQRVWVEISAVPEYRHNERAPYRVLVTMHDFTERKMFEEVLKEEDRKKDEFLAMLGHELRNPMAAISSAVSLLSVENINEESARYAKRVLKQRVKQLSRFVDDLLDVSRITSGKIQLEEEPLELTQVVRAAVEATRGLFEEKRHSLVIRAEERLPAHGDATRLEQVVSNLLSNAAKYTDPGGSICLVAYRDADDAVITVEDNGIGMSEDFIPRIFEMFGQADEARLQRGGLGVGLTVVKRLVELHHGTVEAHSKGKGKGSTFVVRLPLVPGAEMTEEQSQDSRMLSDLSILVIEDSADIAELTASLLRIQGHKVRVALDGATALDAASDSKPDVVLLDLGLPGMDGFQVARDLRNRGLVSPQTTIVAVSGYGQEKDIQQCTEAGIDHHLLKPLEYSELTRILVSRQEQLRTSTVEERSVT